MFGESFGGCFVLEEEGMRYRVGVCLLLVVLGLGCAPGEEDPVKVSVLYPSSGRGDRGVADSVFAGLTFARWRFDADILEVSPRGPEGAGVLLDTVLRPEQEPRVIIATGFEYAESLESRHCEFGGHRVVQLDASLRDCKGLASVSFRTFEPSFLAGVAAVRKSNTGRVAAIGGADLPSVRGFVDGFQAGVEYAGGTFLGPAYIGEGAEGFQNPERALELAREFVAQGADVIFPAAGASGLGVIQGFSEMARSRQGNEQGAERWVIGVDSDQTTVGPRVVLGSVLKRMDLVVVRVMEGLDHGEFRSGSYELGSEERSTEFLLSPGFSAELLESVDGSREAAKEAAARYYGE